jgi:broad specificity phosphatase PhoE
VSACLAAGLPGDVLAAVRGGGHVLLVRHAQTEPGVGDPPGFRIDDCRTQRNLSNAGRTQARSLGNALRTQGIPIAEVRSSQWCRCVETARLAFVDPVPIRIWPALNSFFGDASAEPARTQELRAAVAAAPASSNAVWVTHQVNITALTGIVPAAGEIVIVRPGPGGPVVAGRWAPP